MPYTITADLNPSLPGSVAIVVTGDAARQSLVYRIDGSAAAQPVRNFDTTGSGLEVVIDCEAPLGRPVTYNLVDQTEPTVGQILAQSGPVTCPPPDDGRSLLRSVLRPNVGWMWVEPQDETGVTWETSTTVHRVVGSDTPVVVGEIRQRHAGTMVFLCKSIPQADQLVLLLRDGLPMLLRHSPCAGEQTRDILFFALDVNEVRWGRQGWRKVVVDYQSTKFVPGDTLEPPFNEGWDFDALQHAADDFAGLAALWGNFAQMTTIPKDPVWTGP